MNNDDPDMPVRYVPRPKVKIQPHPDDPDLPVQIEPQKKTEPKLTAQELSRIKTRELIRDRRNKNLVMVMFTIVGFGFGFGSIYGGLSILEHEKGISSIIGFLFGLVFGIALVRGTWEMLGKE